MLPDVHIFSEEKNMVKYLITVALLLTGFSAEAEALVKQSASDALSYRNVVNASSNTGVTSGRDMAIITDDADKEPLTIPAAQEIDLRSGISKNATLTPGQELIILLPETADMSWKVNYDSDNVLLTGNTAKGDVRQVKFSADSVGESAIYFDKQSSSGKIVENKAVYVKVN